MSAPTTTRKPGRAPARSGAPPTPARQSWFRDPWRKPRILETITWAYLAWSLLPVLLAIFMSFSSGRSNSTFQGPLTLQYWVGTGFEGDDQSLFRDPDLRSAIRQTFTLSFATMALAVPLGVAFAIGLDRWRGRPAKGANFVMLMSFVVPEIILGVTALYVVLYLFKFIPLGTSAQIMALVTFQMSYPVIIVRARLLSIGKEYEEAAMDLGAPRRDRERPPSEPAGAGSATPGASPGSWRRSLGHTWPGPCSRSCSRSSCRSRAAGPTAPSRVR